MKQFSKEDRKNIEEIILTYIREYDSNGVIRHLIKNGIDNPKFFRNKSYRLAFKIAMDMHEQEIVVNIESVYHFVKNKIEINKSVRDAYEKFLTINIRHQSIHNIDFFIFLFKEHIIVDFWNNAFERYKDETGPNKDIITNSMYIKEGFENLWSRFTTRSFADLSGGETLKEQAIKQRHNMRNGIATSVKLGLEKFDDFTGGFENSELYILAARPSMGKTTFSVGIIKRALEKGIKVHFFTLEMTRKQIINKFVSDDLGITYKDLKRGHIKDEDFDKVLERYDYYDNYDLLVIDELPSRTLSDMKMRMEEVQSGFIVIDYLQLMQLDPSVAKKNQNREQEVGNISQNLKGFAKLFNAPILALCQLSRSVESRPGNRPILSDLRESGSLEQDADVVMFLFREAYYLKQKDITVPEIQEGNTELIFAKGRELGLDKLNFWVDFKKNQIFEDFKY